MFVVYVQELRSGLGQRQSFIRKPGTEQVLVRIGIGRDGLYKVDGIENKVRGQNSHVHFVDGIQFYNGSSQ